MQKLILLRGLPGAGKSTLALEFKADLVIAADDYLPYPAVGKFSRGQLTLAHTLCQEACLVALAEGKSVVVTNVFSSVEYMEPYFAMAKTVECMVFVATVENYHGNSSVHNVPSYIVSGMGARFKVKLK